VSAGERFDVAVIGAGLAGLTAARELGLRGRGVVVLEARDRLGGRAWHASFAGTQVEMGGGFVHRIQPFIWAELTRYGLDVVDNTVEAERTLFRHDDGFREGDAAAFAGFLSAIDRLFSDARDLIPDAKAFPEHETAREADLRSLRERIDSADLTPEERDRIDALGAGLSSAPNDQVGYLGMAKAYALAGFDAERFLDANGRWTIVEGTRALVDAIAGDVDGDIRTSTAVRAISQAGDGVTIATDRGEIAAAAAIVALPLNTLGDIAFDPPLSAVKREAAEHGSVGRGVKVWARLQPGYPSTFVAAPDRFPLTFAETQGGSDDDGTLVLAFGPSAERLPLADEAGVVRALEEMLPGALVQAVGGHDWTHDPFSKGTWASYAPGTWLRWAPELGRSEGKIAFAGSDIAPGWGAYMDGAIETGFLAAEDIEAFLS
jgi:pseudooxynicotine dehydrogenase